jgi:hypothetical protein
MGTRRPSDVTPPPRRTGNADKDADDLQSWAYDLFNSTAALRNTVLSRLDEIEKLVGLQQGDDDSDEPAPSLQATPAGTLGIFLMPAAPTGWIELRGQVLRRTDYAALDEAIWWGEAQNATAPWGYRLNDPNNPSGSRSINGTFFILPNVQGEFLRFWDLNRGADPGRLFGSFQSQAIQAHNHPISDPGHAHIYTAALFGGASQLFSGPSSASSVRAEVTGASTTGVSVVTSGGPETRPRNIALLACVKT